MADISDINAAQSVKIIGADATGVEQTPVQSTSSGAIHTNLRNNSGTEVGTNSNPIRVDTNGSTILPTYSGTAAAFVPISTAATDVFVITGSATKVVKVHKIKITMTTTSGSPIKTSFLLIKRSTANTGGTSVSGTPVNHDSLDSASTATFRHYTANPTTLGTSLGVVRSDTISVNATGINGGEVKWEFDYAKPLILRGITQSLSINLNGTSVSGPVMSIYVEWTEE